MKFNKIALVCAAAMLLAGCQGTPSESGSSNFVSSKSQTESSEKTESSSESIPVVEPEELKQTGEITETVLYEQNNVKITATGLTYNNYDA